MESLSGGEGASRDVSSTAHKLDTPCRECPSSTFTSIPSTRELTLDSVLDIPAQGVADILAERQPAAPAPADDHLLTVAEAAKYLGLSEASVRMRVKRGAIPVVRLGRLVRFRRDELDAWLRSGAAA